MTGLVAALGMLVLGGVVLIGIGLQRRVPALSDALSQLQAQRPGAALDPVGVGGWLASRWPRPLSLDRRRLLILIGSTPAEFYTAKALGAAIGVLATVPLSAILITTVGWQPPVLITLIGLLLGWCWPDLRLSSRGATIRTAVDEAVFTYFDLVVLERLANRSAGQSLQSAAEISSAPFFLRIRGVLERARLEQRSPAPELRRLAEELDVEPLAELADVMALEDTGASLAEALRARVADLRDAHRNRLTVHAQQVSERMTALMVVPALVFGLLFLVPPLLRLTGH